MTTLRWVVSAALLVGVASAGEAQDAASPVGTAVIDGVSVDYRCIPAPEGAMRFCSEASFANTDFVRAPNLPDSTPVVPGRTAGISAMSAGSGTGGPIGAFRFSSRWYGYQPGTVILATRDVLSTPAGDLYANELSTGITPPPKATMHGAFTFMGRTGTYRHATGSAAAFAQQTGDGVHTVFVLCGWITGIEDDNSH